MDEALHPPAVRDVYDRTLAGTTVRGRWIEVGAGERVHVLETGDGPPLVLLHGTASSGPFLLPMLERLRTVRAVAPDRPGHGLSPPVALPRERYRAAAVEWVDRLLDGLGLDSAAVLGHSMGGLWALWYALARPERVRGLLLIGVPGLPGTSCPLPFRLIATPGVGELLPRLDPPSPRSVVRFAGFMGEGSTIVDYPDLVDLLVSAGADPVAAVTDRAEARALISPFALLSRYGFRRRLRVRPAELGRLAVPTLLIWGDRDPVGSAAVARAVAGQIPDARLEVLPAGHAPWLGHPDRAAQVVARFVPVAADREVAANREEVGDERRT